MLGSLRLFAHAVQADASRLQQRVTTAAICYAIAGVVFAVAFGLLGAVGIIMLADRYGLTAGLSIAAAALVAIGILALAVNALLRMRHRRLKRHAAALRSAAIANTAAAGAAQAQHATPALLPAAAILAFALTNAFLKPSGNDG